MQETQVRSLGQEDSVEKEVTAHLSILAWEIPWTEEPGRLPSRGSERVRHGRAIKHTDHHLSLFRALAADSLTVKRLFLHSRRRQWHPLQYPCLENPWMEEPGGLQSMGSLRVRHD